MTYGQFKDLNRRWSFDKILRDKAFDISKYPKYDGCERGLASKVHTFLIKKLLVEPLRLQINLILNMRIFQTKNLLKNYRNQLLEN